MRIHHPDAPQAGGPYVQARVVGGTKGAGQPPLGAARLRVAAPNVEGQTQPGRRHLATVLPAQALGLADTRRSTGPLRNVADLQRPNTGYSALFGASRSVRRGRAAPAAGGLT